MRPYQQLLQVLLKSNTVIFNMKKWKIFSYPDVPTTLLDREETHTRAQACVLTCARKVHVAIHSLIFTLVSR